MKYLFLDESGDHSLDKIDPQYPIFVLGGVIVERDYAENEMPRLVADFKQRMFGHTNISLHTADITRNRNGFERMKETAFRTRFYTELNQLMRTLDFKIVACAIKKDEHLQRYETAALDPYFLSLQVLIERFCFEIGNEPDNGFIIAEKRNPTLDNQIELAWLALKVQGTRHVKATQISRRISGLALRDKTARLVGLELADLVVTPIGRHVQGKTDKEDFKIIEAKFCQDTTGNYDGHGLIVMPKK